MLIEAMGEEVEDEDVRLLVEEIDVMHVESFGSNTKLTKMI
jgi:hypothetical protein